MRDYDDDPDDDDPADDEGDEGEEDAADGPGRKIFGPADVNGRREEITDPTEEDIRQELSLRGYHVASGTPETFRLRLSDALLDPGRTLKPAAATT